MIGRIWAWLALPALLCGCTVATYPEAGGGAPTATLVFAKGHQSGLTYSGSQTYSISENQACTDTKKAAVLLWTTPHSQEAHVAAGHRIVVLASTTYFYSNGGPYSGVGSTNCGGAASFVLEAGHTYDITQFQDFGDRCLMSVLDEATRQKPPTLKTSDHDSCGPALKD
jgi:hypothetical protein